VDVSWRFPIDAVPAGDGGADLRRQGIDSGCLRRTKQRRQLESVIVGLGRRHVGQDAADRGQNLLDAGLGIRAVSTHDAIPRKNAKRLRFARASKAVLRVGSLDRP
jgi:hypothetical protein